MPASPAGTVPRAWRTVLRLALAVRPRRTLQGLMEVLRGRRLRAWNLLSLLAAEHPGVYAAWIASAERALLPSGTTTVAPSIAIVLVNGEDASARDAVTAVFGRDVPVFDGSAALPTSRPTWLLPIDALDRLSPALATVLTERLRNCDAPLVYWDEDLLGARGRADPWVKPDWDPVLFGAHDGLIGSCVLRADLAPEIVHDWTALAFQSATRSVAPVHIPLILTHRAQKRVAAARAAVSIRPVTISIVIPTRDRADLLEVCLEGLSRTRFPGDHEILIVDNGSVEPRTEALFDRLEASGRGRIIARPGPFNFAALTNTGVAAARGDLICLLNNDIEIRDGDWLTRMAAFALQANVGAVGARLLYPDGAVQHAGVALGIGDAAGHVDKGALAVPGAFEPWHRENRTVSAVTAACLLVARAKFEAVGGMDERDFTIDFNDVDLCLRLAARDWLTIYCADAVLIHHESRSRGTKREGADLARFERELAALRSRWHTVGAIDPYRSPLLRRQSERCLLAF